ncbi:MAG: histidine--tRNA ligase [Bacteroidia bacterium]|nr:histidine--tRNA ligase [Bacteroidia bacterium]
MRDFSPSEMVKRQYIFETIKKVYNRFGYQPIETPAMENTETLLGKYGDEGDKLLFRVLDNGNPLNQITSAELAARFGASLFDSAAFVNHISGKGLRYDLTVPFARYVVMHQNDITFPFKRYQIQPVWRADRPQKGRYREFYQCDADVIGSNSLLNEFELIQMIDEVFTALGLKVLIQLNNRKILQGIAEYIGETEKIIEITVAIDKLDKIGLDQVNNELRSKGISETAIEKLQPVIQLKGTTTEKINALKNILAQSPVGLKGIEELTYIFDLLQQLPLQSAQYELELTLARGLNYYTGAIIEVKVNDLRTDFSSSVLGGGRYDDLTGIFGLPNVSGVGISFGADRIYDVLNALNLFPENVAATTKLLFVNFGSNEEKYCLQLLGKIRKLGITAELFPEAAKMKKQMGYADAKKIPFVAIIGDEEIKSQTITLKNMTTGMQDKVDFETLVQQLS